MICDGIADGPVSVDRYGDKGEKWRSKNRKQKRVEQQTVLMVVGKARDSLELRINYMFEEIRHEIADLWLLL